MTKLLRLLNQIFVLHGTNRVLEKFTISHNPNSHQQVMLLLFGRKYQYAVTKRR